MRSVSGRVASAAAVVLVVAAITLAYLVTRAPHAGAALTLPTPGPGRTTYMNPRFGYTITYPTDWILGVSSDNSIVHVTYPGSITLADSEILTITVSPNPTGLSSQAWWQANHAPDGSETPGGLLKLRSNVTVFTSQAQGQVTSDIYTYATNALVYQLVITESGTSNDAVALDIVNSFAIR